MKKIFFILSLSLLVACTNNDPANNNSSQPEKTITPVAKMAKSSKRGVAFRFSPNRLDDLMLLCPYISWIYNWGNTAYEDAAECFSATDVEFCPMCWNRNYSKSNIQA